MVGQSVAAADLPSEGVINQGQGGFFRTPDARPSTSTTPWPSTSTGPSRHPHQVVNITFPDIAAGSSNFEEANPEATAQDLKDRLSSLFASVNMLKEFCEERVHIEKKFKEACDQLDTQHQTMMSFKLELKRKHEAADEWYSKRIRVLEQTVSDLKEENQSLSRKLARCELRLTRSGRRSSEPSDTTTSFSEGLRQSTRKYPLFQTTPFHEPNYQS